MEFYAFQRSLSKKQCGHQVVQELWCRYRVPFLKERNFTRTNTTQPHENKQCLIPALHPVSHPYSEFCDNQLITDAKILLFLGGGVRHNDLIVFFPLRDDSPQLVWYGLIKNNLEMTPSVSEMQTPLE